MVIAALSLVACDAGQTRYGTGPDTTATPPPPGTVQRATLIVQVAPSLEDSSAVRELGWADGIAGAQVVVTRNAAGATPQTAVTDVTGRATFPQLLTGSYSVSVLRLLAPSETARLSSVNADVNAFGGAVTVSVGAPSTSITLPALGGHRGSLVISELWRHYPRQPNGDQYRYGKFLELYNNSDTSVALADKIVIKGFPGGMTTRSFRAHCTTASITIRLVSGQARFIAFRRMLLRWRPAALSRWR